MPYFNLQSFATMKQSIEICCLGMDWCVLCWGVIRLNAKRIFALRYSYKFARWSVSAVCRCYFMIWSLTFPGQIVGDKSKYFSFACCTAVVCILKGIFLIWKDKNVFKGRNRANISDSKYWIPTLVSPQENILPFRAESRHLWDHRNSFEDATCCSKR